MRFILILTVLIIYTAFKAIQLWPSQRIPAIVIAGLTFALMLGGMFIYRADLTVFNKPWFQTFAWIGSITMGLWATFIILSMPFDILQAIASVTGMLDEIDPAKKESVLYTFHVAVFIFSILLTGFGLTETLMGPTVKEVIVKVKNLPSSLQGLKIAQISDLHVGPTIRKDYVEKVVGLVNATNPDLVIVTGDLADAKVVSIENDLQPLSELKPKYDKFYVTGNHEYYWDPLNFVKKMSELGFQSLVNENRVIQIGDSKLLMAGVTDPMGSLLSTEHTPNLRKAAMTNETTQFKVVIGHRPDVSVEAEPLGFNLQFAGHTHAGQFFPFSLFIGLAHEYTRGLYRRGNMWIYINPGTGYWGPANRLGVRAEITLVKLESE